MENMIHAALEAATGCPNMSREGLVQNIIDRIHVALIAAVYAGHIESNESVVPKFNGIGADSYQHREEYMNYAANFVFPYDDEELYKQHHFYRSIESVNIGGLPFLPGATSLVQKLLDELK